MTDQPYVLADVTDPFQQDPMRADGLLKLNIVNRAAVGTLARKEEPNGVFGHGTNNSRRDQFAWQLHIDTTVSWGA